MFSFFVSRLWEKEERLSWKLDHTATFDTLERRVLSIAHPFPDFTPTKMKEWTLTQLMYISPTDFKMIPAVSV